MKRTFSHTRLGGRAGEERVIETVRIKGDATYGPDDGTMGFQALWFFIQSLQTNPTLLRHSAQCPAEVKFFYDGESWVAESKVVTASPDPA